MDHDASVKQMQTKLTYIWFQSPDAVWQGSVVVELRSAKGRREAETREKLIACLIDF